MRSGPYGSDLEVEIPYVGARIAYRSRWKRFVALPNHYDLERTYIL